jgi:hypothetical protein
MIDLNLEEAHLWEVSPKEPLHGGLLSGLRSEIQETEAPQWRRGRGGGDFCGGSVKLPKSSCEPGNQWKSPLKSELSEMFKTPRRRGSWWLLLAFSWHSMTYRLFIFFPGKIYQLIPTYNCSCEWFHSFPFSVLPVRVICSLREFLSYALWVASGNCIRMLSLKLHESTSRKIAGAWRVDKMPRSFLSLQPCCSATECWEANIWELARSAACQNAAGSLNIWSSLGPNITVLFCDSACHSNDFQRANHMFTNNQIIHNGITWKFQESEFILLCPALPWQNQPTRTNYNILL